MIKTEKATFKCPLCDEIISGNAGVIAVNTIAHYREKHNG